MKKILLNLYYWPVFICLTVLAIVLVPFIILVNRFLYKRTASAALRRAIRIYGWVLVCAIPFMAPVKVRGSIGTIPSPAIFVANHNSAIDPYLFGAIPRENCFVTSWPFKIPVYSPLMKMAGYINTADGWEEIRRKCTRRLNDGVSVIIWPEGHRSRDGKMGRFRKGAFQLAAETGYPLQPVCIVGSGDIMRPGARWLSPGRVQLILLDPIYPAGDKENLSTRINTLRQQTIEALNSCLKNERSSSPINYREDRHATYSQQTTYKRNTHDIC